MAMGVKFLHIASSKSSTGLYRPRFERCDDKSVPVSCKSKVKVLVFYCVNPVERASHF